MPCDNSTAASDALDAAVAGPRRVLADGVEVESQPLPDLIEADRYLASKCAAAGRNPGFGIRFAQLKPPGSA